MRYYTIYPDGKVSGNIRVCQDKDAWYTYPCDHLKVATEVDQPVIECVSYNNYITGFVYASDTEWHTIYVCDVPGVLTSQKAVWRSPYDIVLKDEVYSVVFNLPLGHTMSIDLEKCTLFLHAEGARLYVTRYDRKTKVMGKTERY